MEEFYRDLSPEGFSLWEKLAAARDEPLTDVGKQSPHIRQKPSVFATFSPTLGEKAFLRLVPCDARRKKAPSVEGAFVMLPE